MLAETIKKCKLKIKPYEQDIILALVIILVALISFGLGRLSKIRENKTPITVENTVSNISEAIGIGKLSDVGHPTTSDSTLDKLFVASKNGTKYHYPWCSGALNIKEENKIWFSSKEEAENAGYTPAANCKGL